jgi:hypothetical protein
MYCGSARVFSREAAEREQVVDRPSGVPLGQTKPRATEDDPEKPPVVWDRIRHARPGQLGLCH